MFPVSKKKSDKIFQDTVDQIKNFEQEHGYELGWRFLTCSKTVLKTDPKIAFITLNPGGSRTREDHPSASCEKGSPYLDESWKDRNPGESPLQIQIQKMFDKICEKTNCHGRTRELIESTLSGYFIPFRSPSRNDLKHKKEAFDFGEKIWLRILKTVQPKLFVCIEKETAKRIRKTIETAYDLTESKSYKLQTGWGNYTADIFEFGNNSEVKLLRLPHLSRFTLFTSEKCEEKIEDIFTQFCGTS